MFERIVLGTDISSPAPLSSKTSSPHGYSPLGVPLDGDQRPLVTLVDGDAATRAMLRFLFEDDGCDVVEITGLGDRCPSAHDGLALCVLVVEKGRERTAVSTITRLRKSAAPTPAILITHTADPELRRIAVASGARDVIVLPMGPNDLRKRFRDALGARFATPPVVAADVVRAGGLTLRVRERTLCDDVGWTLALTPLETALLRVLMQSPGQVVGHAELADRIWKDETPACSNALASLVRHLRVRLRQMQRDAGYIHTVHGRGYLFDARTQPRRNPEVARGDGPSVLVVDDDRATRTMISEVLRRSGYNVASGCGPEAPVMARMLQPAVILLDINMPDMDGIQVRRSLHSAPRTASIPVIAISAGTNLRRHSAAMAAEDYLPKPFDIDELLLRVEKWAGAPHLANS